MGPSLALGDRRDPPVHKQGPRASLVHSFRSLYCFAVPLVRYSVAPLALWSVAALARWSVGPPLVRRSVGPSVRRSVGRSLRRSDDLMWPIGEPLPHTNRRLNVRRPQSNLRPADSGGDLWEPFAGGGPSAGGQSDGAPSRGEPG